MSSKRQQFDKETRSIPGLVDPFEDYPDKTPPNELWPFLRWALADARLPLILLVAFSFCFGAVDAAFAYFIGELVDRATSVGPAGLFVHEWLFLLFLVIFVVLAMPIAQLGGSAIQLLAVSPGIYPRIAWRLHRHTLGHSMRYFEGDFAGRIVQKQMQTAQAVTDLTSDTLTAAGLLLAYIIAMIALLGSANPWLAIIVLVWVTGFVAILHWCVPHIQRRAKDQAEARGQLTGQFVDSLSHMKTVKLFAHGACEETAAKDVLSNYREAALAFGRDMLNMRVAITILNALVIVVMIGSSLLLFSQGSASVGVIALATILTLRLTQMSRWISQTAMAIFNALGTIQDGASTLSDANIDEKTGASVETHAAEGSISFEKVTFGYDGHVGAVRDLSFRIWPGEKVGLVGRSGAGKSTALSLLLRLYDPQSGRIAIDGIDTRAFAVDDMRRSIAMVSQEPELFNRSAMSNIQYGKPDASLEEVVSAARLARAHDFIEAMKDGSGRTGYDAHLGENGVKLSGGQRQRVALARAILKDAPIFILDEATSALDSEVEEEIQSALLDFMENKTVIAVAHRLSTLTAMDRILVIDEGHVIEQGTHTELLGKSGLYTALWQRQSGKLDG
ncbi:ABC transporter ATP-binding protein [Roseibium alexandrii]|uniref:ABC-type multidrug transport system, ATPase and permease component n=1 Tax=Roseibium alexandrii (strain DSM 17067 / NCIMB 14079 / DFL-11) TaxID=244592 RepID=A0A5E8H209_ROSAD|nr:ABC transporter ATP-binding protein [Roseibium alexandrii]EEE45863.1 ABC-type multidrug transport system, ATPase and permease component [Roseibium alexandrii DFL-11]